MSRLKDFLRSMMGTPRIDGLIPAGAVLQGTLEFSGALWIDAEVQGTVRARHGERSMLIIGPRARITGTIEADEITVHGTVTGRICAHESLAFEHGAQVNAEEIVHHGFTIRAGAHVEGAIVRHPAPGAPATPLRPQAKVQLLRARPLQREAGTGLAELNRSAGPA